MPVIRMRHFNRSGLTPKWVAATSSETSRMKFMPQNDVGHFMHDDTIGSMGVRAAAGEIGISPATPSRVKNGRVPDLETLRRHK